MSDPTTERNGLRFIELATIHAADQDVTALARTLTDVGFDPVDPVDLALNTAAAVAVSFLVEACDHARLAHGCPQQPADAIARWATERAWRVNR